MCGIGRLVCWTFTKSLASFRLILLRVQRIGKTRPLLPVLGLVVFYVFFLLVVLVNGLGIVFLALARVTISDLNQLSAERKSFPF